MKSSCVVSPWRIVTTVALVIGLVGHLQLTCFLDFVYSRFWELDLDRDYRITRDDLLKYGTNKQSIAASPATFS
jgi:hypothetical protein